MFVTQDHLVGWCSATDHVEQPESLKRFDAEILRQRESQQHASTRDTARMQITRKAFPPDTPFSNFPPCPSTGLQVCLLLPNPALTGTAAPQISRSDKQAKARGSQS